MNETLDEKLTIFNLLFYIIECRDYENSLYALRFVFYICHVNIFA